MIRLFREVTKFNLSAAVTLSAVFAYVLAGGRDTIPLIISTFAVLLLALGVSALNQYQEWESDAKMTRTKRRPIPSGRIAPGTVLTISIMLIVTAFLIIFFQLGYSGLVLFLFVPIWYNGFYTNFKRRSAFAVVPGGLLGVIPPAIGWLAAGRSLAEPEFLALGLLFFVWQVPHFWLLMTKYDHDYRSGGFPTAIDVFGPIGFRWVLFVWWMLTIFCALFATVVFGIHTSIWLVLLLTLDLTAAFVGVQILFGHLTPNRAGFLFHGINIFLLGTVILLSIDGL